MPHPEIIERMAPHVSIAPSKRLLVESDGEVETTPARFWLLPKTLRLKI